MRGSLVFCLVIFSVVNLIECTSRADEQVSHGDFGAIISMTDDGVQVGPTWMTNNWEAFFTIDASALNKHNSIHGTLNHDLGTTLRLGKRWMPAANDFIVAGLQYYQNWDGFTATGYRLHEYHGGPYIGFERQFPGTGISLIAFAVPFGFSYTTDAGAGPNDDNGNPTTQRTANWEIFQMGGFGMTYLF